MNKYLQILIGALAAGATQFGILVAAGVTQVLPLSAGVLGSMGATVAGLLRQLPQREWSPEERVERLGENS